MFFKLKTNTFINFFCRILMGILCYYWNINLKKIKWFFNKNIVFYLLLCKGWWSWNRMVAWFYGQQDKRHSSWIADISYLATRVCDPTSRFFSVDHYWARNAGHLYCETKNGEECQIQIQYDTIEYKYFLIHINSVTISFGRLTYVVDVVDLCLFYLFSFRMFFFCKVEYISWSPSEINTYITMRTKTFFYWDLMCSSWMNICAFFFFCNIWKKVIFFQWRLFST